MIAQIGTRTPAPTDCDERTLARFQLLRPALEGAVPLARLARERGIPLRTLRRWLAAYRRAGIGGLARRPRSDRGAGRRLHPEVRRLIAAITGVAPRPTAATVHRQVAALAAERGWPSPCYGTVHALVRRDAAGPDHDS